MKLVIEGDNVIVIYVLRGEIMSLWIIYNLTKATLQFLSDYDMVTLAKLLDRGT